MSTDPDNLPDDEREMRQSAHVGDLPSPYTPDEGFDGLQDDAFAGVDLEGPVDPDTVPEPKIPLEDIPVDENGVAEPVSTEELDYPVKGSDDV